MIFGNIMFLATEAVEETTTFKEAGLNTLMGLGIVFLALAFISLIISLEGKIFTSIGKKKTAVPVVKNDEPAPVVDEPEADDLGEEEIAAVISAAIYAYESENGGEVPADGLVVRSIRRMGCVR